MSESKFVNQKNQTKGEKEMNQKKNFEMGTNPSLDELIEFEQRS